MVAPVRNELVHTKLLHDQAGHAHAHAGAQDGQQPGKSGNQKYLPPFYVAPQQARQIHVQYAYEQRAA